MKNVLFIIFSMFFCNICMAQDAEIKELTEKAKREMQSQ